MYGNTAPLNATIELRVELGGRDDARPMSHPPDDLEDGDPFLEWERENAATSIDLLPVDLAEIEREESTPTVVTEKLAGYDVGRRDGIYELIVDVRAVFTEAKNTPEFVDNLALLLARRAGVPWPPRG